MTAIYALYVTSTTGYVSVMTFSSSFARSRAMDLLRVQPVTLRTVDYQAA